MSNKTILSERMKKLRKEQGYTQEQVAKILNISVAALSRYETGAFEPKSVDLIVDLAFLYKVSTDYLLGKTNAKNPEIDFDKLDIGLSSETYENLTEAQKVKIRKIIAILVND